jgi:putative acetyltransferase
MNCSISQFTIESYDDVYSLWQNTEGIGLSECDTKEGISTYLERNPGMSFIAEVNGEIVGAVLCGHDGRRGYVHHLAVRKDFQNQGLGRQLVEKCLSVLQKIGIKKCHLFIFNNNIGGIDFWKSIGWTQRSDISIVSKNIP